MRLRRVRAAGAEAPVLAVEHEGTWVPLAPELVSGASEALRSAAGDLVAFLAGGAELREEAAALAAEHGPGRPPEEEAALLPFTPRSFRDFSIFPDHMRAASRGIARAFAPPPFVKAMEAWERVTDKPFPPLRAKPLYWERPIFYLGNHTVFHADGEEVPYPRNTEHFDFELELGFVLTREVADATAEEGEAAIGGFVLLNDWSARDVQADENRRGMLTSVTKSKDAANSLGAVVVTADELLGSWAGLRATARVNGEVWGTSTLAGAAHGIGDMVAYASLGTRLGPGDLLGLGTVPGCCGAEHERFLAPGDLVELELTGGFGRLANRLGPRA